MFHGSMVALITPMHTDGTIDWHKLEQLIEWHIAEGTDAIVSVGTTGESATLAFDEHKAVVRFTVDIAKKRIPIIAGAGANSTKEAIELTISAYQGGCDATLQVTPYYNKPPQRGLYAHFEQIARSVPLPMILYNVPGRTACDIAPQTTAALAKISNIIGIKEATPIERLREIRPLFPKGSAFKIYSGEDGICAEAICEGLIDGVISVTANAAPKLMATMMKAGLSGDYETCLNINSKLADLHKNLFAESNPIPVKWALHRMGRADIGIRLPLMPLDEKLRSGLETAMQQATIL